MGTGKSGAPIRAVESGNAWTWTNVDGTVEVIAKPHSRWYAASVAEVRSVTGPAVLDRGQFRTAVLAA